MPRVEPERVRVRMYNIGQGDCFLVSFEYAEALPDGRSERHILFDFGTKRLAEGGPGTKDIAKLIKEHSGGTLDIIVLSHRHQDHMSGFGVASSKVILDKLNPRLIVRPWTENPDLDPGDETPVGDLSVRFQRFLTDEGTLLGKRTSAAELLSLAGSADDVVAGFAEVAYSQVKNKVAIDQLDKWARDDKGFYVHYGSDLPLEDFIPGVSARVLGPPTPDQHPDVAGQRSDSDEYWVSLSSVLSATSGRKKSSKARGARGESALTWPQRWIVHRLRRVRLKHLTELVRWLDEAMNNTSVILLLKVRGRRLLFPGDAQGENWEYTLSEEEDKHELSLVDLYKVGHHGSRNATPKSLWNLWNEESTRGRRIACLMSTSPGFYKGGERSHGEVPRETLVAALRERMQDDFYSSHELGEEEPCLEIACELSDPGAAFERV